MLDQQDGGMHVYQSHKELVFSHNKLPPAKTASQMEEIQDQKKDCTISIIFPRTHQTYPNISLKNDMDRLDKRYSCTDTHITIECLVQAIFAVKNNEHLQHFLNVSCLPWTSAVQPRSRWQLPGKRYLYLSALFNKYEGRWTAE